MKIGIMGSGDVGRILGTAFIREGYEVMLGTRDIQKKGVVQWLADNPGAAAGSFEEAAKYGELIVFADEQAGMRNGEGTHVINMPHIHDVLTPILYTLPLQLLSYYVAVLKGTDVDQPRNLAKSVTVE